MPSLTAHIVVESPILQTPRVQQVRGMFDLPEEKTSRLSLANRLSMHLILGFSEPVGASRKARSAMLWGGR